MPEKRETLEDVAAREKHAADESRDLRANLAAGQEKLAKDVPEHFFKLAAELRQAVVRFNQAAAPERRLDWRESPAVVTRGEHTSGELHGDFNLSFGRKGATVNLWLLEMTRGKAANAYLIEAAGEIQRDRFLLRVEGAVLPGGKTGLRMSLDLKRLTWPAAELADRLVLTVVKENIRELMKGVS